MAPTTASRSSALAALLFLFFVQLLTTWFENIYRMSLIKLQMGTEMYGILLLLLPLLVLLIPRAHQGAALTAAVGTMLVTRALIPLLSAPALIVNCGLGLAAAIAALALALGTRWPFGDIQAAAAAGLLLSVVFRSWGSSLDISLGGPGRWIGWALVLIAALLALRHRSVVRPAADTAVAPVGLARTFMESVGLFSNLAVVYLVLSSPAVVSAWSGSHYLPGVVLLALGMTVVAAIPGQIPAPLLILLNLVFSGALVGGILLYAVPFPATPESAPVVVPPAPEWMHTPFYLMFLCAPVILFNLQRHFDALSGTAPAARRIVLPILLGMALLFGMALLLVFSNVWGYVGPIGAFMRGKFYLPFAVAAVLMLLALLTPTLSGPKRLLFGPVSGAARFVSCLVLAGLAITGVLVRAARPGTPQDVQQLRVLTYNIQQGSALDGDQRYREQLELIKKINPDIIGLQESDTPRPSGGNVDVTRYFAEGLGYYSYYGPSVISGTFGTSILSRFPIENPRSIFTYSTVDETGTAVAEIFAGSRRIAFFNNHPAGPPVTHHAHIDAMLAAAGEYDHVIAVGDFNFRPDSPYYAKAAAQLTESWKMLHPDGVGPRNPELDPDAEQGDVLDMNDRIDLIFFGGDMDVSEAWYLPTPASQTDHPVYWATLDLK